MAELPNFVWMAAGVFIGLTSLFLGFIKPIEHNAFFKLMFVVGIGMLIYGFIKGKLSRKSMQETLEDRRMQNMRQRGENEVDIDIDDYRNNPRLRQETLQKRSSPYSSSTQPTHYGTPRTHPMQQQQAYHAPSPQHHPSSYTQHPASQQKQSFCSQCGTPLLKSHKFCPICGARV